MNIKYQNASNTSSKASRSIVHKLSSIGIRTELITVNSRAMSAVQNGQVRFQNEKKLKNVGIFGTAFSRSGNVVDKQKYEIKLYQAGKEMKSNFFYHSTYYTLYISSRII